MTMTAAKTMRRAPKKEGLTAVYEELLLGHGFVVGVYNKAAEGRDVELLHIDITYISKYSSKYICIYKGKYSSIYMYVYSTIDGSDIPRIVDYVKYVHSRTSAHVHLIM